MTQHIGRYEIEAEVGQGAFESVYRAYDPQLAREVAIKVLRGAESSDLMARLRYDIEAIGNLHHQNIETIYELGEHAGMPYIVSELLKGQTLQELLSRGAGLTLFEKVRILVQVADALRFAHEHYILHGDVRPANIVRLHTGEIKLTGFGISRFMGVSPLLTERGDARFGPLAYMAPDVFRGADRSIAGDIFAFGVVGYELVSGKHPFASGSSSAASETIFRITASEPEPLGDLAPACPEALEALVSRAMAKNPEMRYQSMDDIWFGLSPIMFDVTQEEISALIYESSLLVKMGHMSQAQEKMRQALRLRAVSKWSVVLGIDRSTISDVRIDEITRALHRATGDDKLTFESVESGSVVLKLNGSVDGYKVLDHLFKSGKLSDVLGLPVESVSFVTIPESSPADISGVDSTRNAVRIFCSYSHKDRVFRQKLDNYLRVLERNGMVQIWHDRRVMGGEDWRGQIDEHLESAEMILILVSADFLGSDYCYDVEMRRALERHRLRQARVIPIILRPSPWRESPLSDLQALPDGGKAVTEWTNRDAAFSNITDGIRNVVQQLQSN